MENILDYGMLGFKSDILGIDNDKNEYKTQELRISKELEQALESIRKSIGDEKEDEVFYSYLISLSPDDETKMILESIREDERKHNRYLKEIYYDLTGVQYKNENSENIQPPMLSFAEGIKKAFFGETDASEKYRNILKAMESKKNYDKILEIALDELKHSSKYNYLIHKHNI